MRRFVLPLLSLVTLLLLIANAPAEVLASQSTSFINSSTYLNQGVADLAVSFSLTSSFDDVSISANLANAYNFGSTGTAFLTTQIGAGTTTANQIASATFSPAYSGSNAFTSVTPTTLFSNLTLTAGTYYLVLSSNSSIDTLSWEGGSSVTTTTAPGVSIGATDLTDNFHTTSSYIPADSFSPYQNVIFDGEPTNYLYTVTGVAAPEPNSVMLMLASLAGLGLFLKVGRASH